jgi:hypothetical protein
MGDGVAIASRMIFMALFVRQIAREIVIFGISTQYRTTIPCS